jgi:hypothetical protein
MRAIAINAEMSNMTVINLIVHRTTSLRRTSNKIAPTQITINVIGESISLPLENSITRLADCASDSDAACDAELLR